LAKSIQDMVGASTTPKQREQRDMLMRAWTFMNNTYEQVAKPGRWLFNGRGAEIFVSLISAGRKPRRKSKAQGSAVWKG
jgi:hypothetical protein